jgi:RNA polymerase sigma-70 factor (ECF subfamily)
VATVELPADDLCALRRKLRFKVSFKLGFACPDIDDIVQETLARFLQTDKEAIRDAERTGAFLNGICQNVIQEYRRRWERDGPIADPPPDIRDSRASYSEVFEMHDAVISGLRQLSERDAQMLRMFYIEERSKSEISAVMGITEENFRVVLCRAKERFRQIYSGNMKRNAAVSHS